MIIWTANVQWVLLSTLMLGIASGLIGTLSYFKKQSLMSDALAHAALPGVVIAFLLIGYKSLWIMLIGAFISALIGGFFVQKIKDNSRVKEDAAMGIVLSVFFGLGIMLLTYANRLPNGGQSGLDSFIFGQAASMVSSDVKTMLTLAAVIIFLVLIFYKEWKVYLFDISFAQGIGLRISWMNRLYLFLLVSTIVIGIQAVGVILMAALLIIPAVSARYWTNRFGPMIIISALIGGGSGVIGTLFSTMGKSWPTGPFIVVIAASCFICSFMFGVKNGMVVRWFKQKQLRMSKAIIQVAAVKESDRA